VATADSPYLAILGTSLLQVGPLRGVRILGEVRFQGADQVHRAGAFVHGTHEVLLLFDRWLGLLRERGARA
jgi:hypothetical protein